MAGPRARVPAQLFEDCQIDQCLSKLTETKDYIEITVQRLNEERQSFEMEKARCIFELKRQKEIHEERVVASKDQLAKERREFEETKKAGLVVLNEGKTHIVTMDVGGNKFSTDIRTLRRQEDSMFLRIVENFDDRRSDTHVFIDRDSKHFRLILNYMRQGEEVMCSVSRVKDPSEVEEIICEAKYYCLKRFVKLLERHRVRLVQKTPTTFTNLVKNKYFKSPSQPNHPYETTNRHLFKGVNMEGIEFENVHFRHSVSFEGSILKGAKFKLCRFDAIVNFSDADISDVSFEHCINATPDRFVMDGVVAENCRVTFNPPMDLGQFSVTYRAK